MAHAPNHQLYEVHVQVPGQPQPVRYLVSAKNAEDASNAVSHVYRHQCTILHSQSGSLAEAHRLGLIDGGWVKL
jgi:hypothetical protein